MRACVSPHDLVPTGLYEDTNEAQNREHVLGSLDRIVKQWVRLVLEALGYASSICEDVNAKLFTFGSYRLGVHGPGSCGRMGLAWGSHGVLSIYLRTVQEPISTPWLWDLETSSETATFSALLPTRSNRS